MTGSDPTHIFIIARQRAARSCFSALPLPQNRVHAMPRCGHKGIVGVRKDRASQGAGAGYQMEETVVVCPRCGQAETRKNAKDRRGTQVYACTVCARTFTALTARPCSGYRFRPT